MSVTRLEPGSFYWAKSKSGDDQLTIVQVSSVFGDDQQYWTLATVGTDQHYMPSDFDIVSLVQSPAAWNSMRQAAE